MATIYMLWSSLNRPLLAGLTHEAISGHPPNGN
jgi:hypothetical protein